MGRYSRFESVEEKRNFRNAAVLLILTVGSIVLLFIYGIPLVGKVSSFVSGLRGSTDKITNSDKTPPIPPRFNTLPDFTNQKPLSIAGTAEPGTTVKLKFNNKTQENIADRDGNFIFQDVNLVEGDNVFSANTTDSAGNVSQDSKEKKIVYDTKPPELNINSPADGTKLYGNTQRQINIEGTSESGVNLTINDRFVSVDDTGKFQYPVTLNSGDNSFTIKAIDAAGNLTEKSIVLNFND